MPYSFPNRIPRPAKNWSESEQKKCIAAANAVLGDGGTEQAAIFACIHAAGRSKPKKEGSGMRGRGRGRGPISLIKNLVDYFAQDGVYKKGDEEGEEGEESYDVQMTRARQAWYDAHEHRNDTMPTTAEPWVREIYPSYIILEGHADGLQKVPYTEHADGAIEFGTPTRVVIEYREAPVDSKSTMSTMVFKQADGRYRWVGIVSNHFRDLDTPREIISSAAHQEYVDYVYKTGVFPELWLWHTPEAKIGKADMVDFFDGFLIGSGLFDEGKESVAEKLASHPEPLTMSHMFFRLRHDGKSVVTDRYRMREMTILPEGVEANPWTNFATMKEDTEMPLNKRDFLAQFLTPEDLDKIESTVTDLRKQAEAAGVDWKDVVTAATDVQAAPPPPAAPPSAPDTDAIVKSVYDALRLKELSDALTAINERLDDLGTKVVALSRSDDKKVAAAITPRAVSGLELSWSGKAASASKETVIDPDDEDDVGLGAARPALLDFLDSAMSGMPSRVG